jgi:methylenetetrahydrofolate dehydrogenase (NADP+)/methenyltetrahydrofolate cyclohydrolase
MRPNVSACAKVINIKLGSFKVIMTADLILGKEISQQIYGELDARIDRLKKSGVTPGLAVVLVGEDPASQTYVRMKGKMCRELGMHSDTIIMPETTTQEELLARVEGLNSDPGIHGFLIQLPLPKHIDEQAVINAIDPSKDVDCFHPFNVGKMLIGEPEFLPATPAGVQQLLIRSGVETDGKHVVVVGRSNIVGKPMAAMMVQKTRGANSTVTVVHSRTEDIGSITRQADILIVAIGKAGFITPDMVKEGSVVIDVGTNHIPDPTAKKGTRLVGDVDENVKEKASAMTPVPGGVGPMTICMLMSNTVHAAERAYERKCSQ